MMTETRNEIDSRLQKEMAIKRQILYANDAKRTYGRLIKDMSPQCTIDGEKLHDYFEEKWKKQTDTDEIIAEQLFGLNKTMTEEMTEKLNKHLMDMEKMKELIRTRGNLSAPGLDGLTNPVLKLEREAAARMTINLMETLLNTGICPDDWKGARTILIYQGGEKNNPANWRPITITSVIYRLIFCRIAQSLHAVHVQESIDICDPDQKGFIPNKAGCMNIQQLQMLSLMML
jgi:hypothetical protein